MPANIMNLGEKKMDHSAEQINEEPMTSPGNLVSQDQDVIEGCEAWKRIKTRGKMDREDWRKVGRALRKGREEHPANIEFGEWCRQNGFGDIDRRDRADAMWLDEMWEEVEFVVRDTDNGINNPREIRKAYRAEQKCIEEAKPSKPAPEKRRRAIEAAEEIAEEGGEVTPAAIQARANVGKSVAAEAMLAHKAREEGREEGREEALADVPLEELGLATPAKAKLEKAIAAHKKRLDREFDLRVHQEARKFSEGVSLPHYFKALDAVQSALKHPPSYAALTSKEYKQILMCLHPDGLNSRTEEQLTVAFRVFQERKLKLVNEEREREEEARKIARREAGVQELPSREEMLRRAAARWGK